MVLSEQVRGWLDDFDVGVVRQQRGLGTEQDQNVWGWNVQNRTGKLKGAAIVHRML